MKKAAAFFMCLISNAALSAEPIEAKTCPLTQLASVDLTIDSAGRVLVPVKINEQEVNLLLMLENGRTRLTRATAQQLGMNAREQRPGKAVRPKSFSIGGLAYSDMTVFVDDPLKSESYAGRLGMNAFGNVDIEIDVARKKLILFSQEHCPGAVVYWDTRFDVVPLERDIVGQLSFQVELDGRKISTALSVYVESTISERLTRSIFDFERESNGVEREIGPDGREVAYFRSMQIQSNGLAVMNAKVEIREERSPCTIKTSKTGPAAYANCFGVEPFVLGRDATSRMRIYLATKEKKMYFTVNQPVTAGSGKDTGEANQERTN